MKLLSQMLTQIRNALAVHHEAVTVPFSEFNFKIALLLEEAGFVGTAIRKQRGGNKALQINLKYDSDGQPLISSIKQISKSGQRIYKGYKELRPIKNGYGIAIVSTPQGIMSNKEARKRKLGGEVLCEIW